MMRRGRRREKARGGGTRDGVSTTIKVSACSSHFFFIVFVPYTSDCAFKAMRRDSFGPCAFSVTMFAPCVDPFLLITLDSLGTASEATLCGSGVLWTFPEREEQATAIDIAGPWSIITGTRRRTEYASTTCETTRTRRGAGGGCRVHADLLKMVERFDMRLGKTSVMMVDRR